MPVLTVADTRSNWVVQAANSLVEVGERTGILARTVDMPTILEAAKQQSGLDDFGDDGFREPMQRIVDCANSVGLSPLGRQIATRTYLEAAVIRLQRRELFKQRPEIAAIAVERPVFVLGFPRSGTTVLQNLLGLPSQRRALEFWELSRPIPQHTDPVLDARRRIQTARTLLRVAYLTNPEMRLVHEVKTATKEECWPLFCPSFAVLNWDLGVGASAYGDWLMTHNMVPAYAEYRQMLQLLLHQRPANQLVLKCPEHLWFLDALLQNFPDACIVWTHRNPFNALASYCSLISLQWRTMYGEFNPERIGQHILRRFAEGIDRAMMVRDQVGEGRFFDVDFLELVEDQAAMTSRITSFFDIAPTAQTAMETYLATSRGDARGQHKYDAAMYGLERERVLDRFKTYIDRFGIDCGAAGGR